MTPTKNVLKGAIFRRTIRSSYASLDIIVKLNHSEIVGKTHVFVIVNFHDCRNVSIVRSNIKRTCKIGNEIELDGVWDNERRFHVHLEEAEVEATDYAGCILGLRIVQQQKLNKIECQKLREKFYPTVTQIVKGTAICNKNEHENQLQSLPSSEIEMKQENSAEDVACKSHASGISKRKQGEIVRDFLIQRIIQEIIECQSVEDELTGNQKIKSTKQDGATLRKAIDFLNQGSGIMDVAGGNGHVSLAFSLYGIKSTVIDPRETVGKLPGRDRKVLRKAIHGYSQSGSNHLRHDSTLPPPLEYNTFRAWFANRPDGIDSVYREGSSLSQGSIDGKGDAISNSIPIPICTLCSPTNLVQTCSAIVALHPDEATGDIVDFAVEHKIPFLVVPCCVFSRLFPNRFIAKGENGQGKKIVSTYNDLIQFLASKHESIRISKLDFDGANTVLWSIFVK